MTRPMVSPVGCDHGELNAVLARGAHRRGDRGVGGKGERWRHQFGGGRPEGGGAVGVTEVDDAGAGGLGCGDGPGTLVAPQSAEEASVTRRPVRSASRALPRRQ